MNQISKLKVLLTFFAAPVFGVVYWQFLEQIQPGIVNDIYNCNFCERCANILYDREQIVLAFCAGLAFFVVIGFLKLRGWRGILKSICASVLCFQIYSLVVIKSVIASQECTALHRERSFPLISLVILLIQTPLTAIAWSSFCSVVFLVYQGICEVVFRQKEDSRLTLK